MITENNGVMSSYRVFSFELQCIVVDQNIKPIKVKKFDPTFFPLQSEAVTSTQPIRQQKRKAPLLSRKKNYSLPKLTKSSSLLCAYK